MASNGEMLADAPVAAEIHKRNKGWFRAADTRINRRGRPKVAKVITKEDVDLAPTGDRLKVVMLSARDMAYRLTNKLAPWIANLPSDYQIVGCRVDEARDRFAVVIRSAAFPLVAKDRTIPAFEPEWNGLLFKRKC